MGGQVLGGGVIVLVAVLLWLVYLLPSWQSRYQYNAAERNAVRLNQALRILAETSETPEEVRLELNTRTALAQQRLAKRAAAEREQAELELSRAELEAARVEREAAEAAARARRIAATEVARIERAAAHAAPAARRARARRRFRLAATIVALAGVALAGWGGWQVALGASQVALWAGVVVVAVAGALLVRMARVASRAVVAPVAVAPATAERVAPEFTDLVDRSWTPRALPQPLASAAGTRAAVAQDTADARRALDEAARAEALRARAAELRPAPTDIAVARASREDAEMPRTGSIDDEAIEAHVRELLARRAVG